MWHRRSPRLGRPRCSHARGRGGLATANGKIGERAGLTKVRTAHGAVVQRQRPLDLGADSSKAAVYTTLA